MRYEVWIGETPERNQAQRVLSQNKIPTIADLLANRVGLLLEVCFLWPFEKRWAQLERQLANVPKKGNYYTQIQLFGMDFLVCERPPIFITVFINE